jgi:hypothetical protein
VVAIVWIAVWRAFDIDGVSSGCVRAAVNVCRTRAREAFGLVGER